MTNDLELSPTELETDTPPTLERLSEMALNMEDMCSDLRLESDECDDIIESIESLVYEIQTRLDQIKKGE